MSRKIKIKLQITFFDKVMIIIVKIARWPLFI